MHRWHADGEGCVTPGITLAIVVPLARLVPLHFDVAGQARAASLLGCPTVPPAEVSRPCERSGQHHAPVARTRVLQFLSLHEKRIKKVGQWVRALNLGAFKRPTSILNSGAGRTTEEEQIAEGVCSSTLLGRWVHIQRWH